MSSVSTAPEAPWRAGLHSARALLWPGLALQTAAVALVLAYYFLPATQGVFARIAAWQTAGGLAFSALSTAICGGLVPFLFLHWHPETRTNHPWRHLWFFIVFWSWKGAEVDLWYRLLSHLYGTGHDVRTIALKVVTDQFVYNTVYTSPIGSLCFAWKDAGYRWAPVAADLRAGKWYYRRILPVLCAVWTLWIPVVCCVYALPVPLQMPLFDVVLCFWAMLYAHITARQNRTER